MVNRSGFITESIFIITSLLAILLIILVLHYVQDVAIDGLNQTAMGNDTNAMDALVNSRTNFASSADTVPLIFAAFLIIGAAVLGFVLPTHFVFFVIGIVLLFPTLFISGILGQVFSGLINETILNTTIPYYPNVEIVGSNLPTIALISDLSFLFAMFVKKGLQ